MSSRDGRTASPEQLKRLGAAVYHRRWEDLHMRQEDVTAAGGPSSTTLSKLETGDDPKTPSRKTLEKLDVGLGWEPGSAWACLWDGADPAARDELSGPRARRLLAAAPVENRGGWFRRLLVLREELDQIIDTIREGEETPR